MFSTRYKINIMKIANKNFDIGKRTYVMGILNVTPDSFSDGGNYKNEENAIKRAKEMVEQGADIIDVGGESTRPDHIPIEESEEIKRVIPIIKAIKSQIDIPISIDTYKARVAELAILEGASMINDIWGFKRDPMIAVIAAKYGVICCLMHNRVNSNYINLIDEIINDLKDSINLALNAGVKYDNIIIDPGIGFAKSYEQNLLVMKKFEVFKSLGYPVLLGTSRKSLIGNTLKLPTEQRIEGTIVTTALGIVKGCDFVRVHDVLENKKACMMADAIVRYNTIFS